MINVTNMLKLESKELKDSLALSMKNITFNHKEIKLVQSPYDYNSFELAGLSGTTFDFLARIRMAKKIGCKNILDVIKIPHNVINNLRERGLDSFPGNENHIDVHWFINRFDYIVNVLNKYLLGEYDIRAEIIQIGFNLACMETLYRSNRKNNFLYTDVTPVFKNDMILMLKNFNEEFISNDTILKPNSNVIFNPIFGSLLTSVKADGDIIIDNCLFDLKTRKRLDIKSDIEQLIIYNTLNKINETGIHTNKIPIEKIASYNPRFKGVFLVNINQINQDGESMLTEYILNRKWLLETK